MKFDHLDITNGECKICHLLGDNNGHAWVQYEDYSFKNSPPNITSTKMENTGHPYTSNVIEKDSAEGIKALRNHKLKELGL